MINGYMGKLLLVNLTDSTFEERELTEDMARKFMGGFGIGALLLYNMMKSGVDPLGPDNILGFLTGPLTGTPALFSGRYTVVCKSPVYGGWNDANSGGFFGPELKRAGFDGIFIKGTSKKPVYLWINDGKVEIRDATALWGKDVIETEDAIKSELGEKNLRIAMIGPAGEKLSLISAIMNDGHRAAGRGGVGAVMGSKNLKAVVVRGTGKVPVADPDGLREVNKEIISTIKGGIMAEFLKAFSNFGTSLFYTACALSGDSPVKNWGGATFADFSEEEAKRLEVFPTDAKYKIKKFACANCPIGCGAIYNHSEVGETGRPEYETGAAFGCLILNSDPEIVIKCNHICNAYGIDTISAGGTIAWAIECYENGILTKDETGGIELKWRNAEAIVEAMRVLADQSTEFGKILALGSEGAAKKMGKGFEYLQTIKGIELPMHDPKFCPGYMRTLHTDPTPARHTKGGLGTPQLMNPQPSRFNFQGTGPADVKETVKHEVLTAAGLCMFCAFVGMQDLVEKLIRAVTGWDFGDQDIRQTGLRIFSMKHAFNLREGLNPSDYRLPKRLFGEPPLEKGPNAGIKVDYKALARNFFEEIGWDGSTGIPSRDSFEKLGIMEDVIKDLNLL